MNPKISLTVFTGIVAVALVLMWWNFSLMDEYKSTFDFMLVNALPTFEAEEEKKFNDLVEKYITQEYRYLTENLTESQRNVLGGILAVGGDDLMVENIPDNLKNLASKEDPPPDLEHEALMKKVNDTETARLALGLGPAPSPVQFEEDEEITLHKVPYTAPGQISINTVSGSGERSIMNNHSDFTPLGWSGTISFDDGTKQKSVIGHGWDRFIMDCNPGTIFGVSMQKDSEYGYLEVSITGNEIEPLDPSDDIWGEAEETYAPYGIVSITSTCPSFDPAIAEELLSYRN